MRRQHLSIRNLKRMRRDVPWRVVEAVRHRLQPYRTYTKQLSAGTVSSSAARTAAWAVLGDVVALQQRILHAQGASALLFHPRLSSFFFIVQKRVLQWEGILSVQLKDGPKL